MYDDEQGVDTFFLLTKKEIFFNRWNYERMRSNVHTSHYRLRPSLVVCRCAASSDRCVLERINVIHKKTYRDRCNCALVFARALALNNYIKLDLCGVNAK